MRQMKRSLTYLWTFGRLLKRLRGETPLIAVADQCGVDSTFLRTIEEGRRPIDEASARRILVKGFAMERQDIAKAILGLQLYDLGLRDNQLRLLVIDAITGGLTKRELVAFRAIRQPHS